MTNLFNFNKEKTINVVCIAPHPDDIELGLGATLMRMVSECNVNIYYVLLSGNSVRLEESMRAIIRLGLNVDIASLSLSIQDLYIYNSNTVKRKNIDRFFYYDFIDGCLSKQEFLIYEELKKIRCIVNPDILVIPSIYDFHQDHKLSSTVALEVFNATLNIIQYNRAQYTTNKFNPNFSIDADKYTRWLVVVRSREHEDLTMNIGGVIDSKLIGDKLILQKEGSYAQRKVDLLLECFVSQLNKSYFNHDRLFSYMNVVGGYCNCNYAEAFQINSFIS